MDPIKMSIPELRPYLNSLSPNEVQEAIAILNRLVTLQGQHFASLRPSDACLPETAEEAERIAEVNALDWTEV